MSGTPGFTCWISFAPVFSLYMYVNEVRNFHSIIADFTKKYAPFELTVPDIYSVDNQIKYTYPGNNNAISLFPPIRRVHIQNNIFTMQFTMGYNR